MTRHAEMERPDEVQEAEFARIGMASVPVSLDTVRELARAAKGLPNHRAPYDGAAEQNFIDRFRWVIDIERSWSERLDHRWHSRLARHTHPYSTNADRLVGYHDGRHVIRNHRAEGAAS